MHRQSDASQATASTDAHVRHMGGVQHDDTTLAQHLEAPASDDDRRRLVDTDTQQVRMLEDNADQAVINSVSTLTLSLLMSILPKSVLLLAC